MLTWPSPGMRIGSCMRKTFGATSVTLGSAVSCSCRCAMTGVSPPEIGYVQPILHGKRRLAEELLQAIEVVDHPPAAAAFLDPRLPGLEAAEVLAGIDIVGT